MRTGAPILFVDRDGTLIEEPEDFQIDRLDKLRFVAGVIPAMLRLRDAGYQFVVVSNQDGLGRPEYPQAAFDGPQALMMQVFASQGITFREVLIDCSFPADNAPTRKPALGLVQHYLKDRGIDWARSAMVGDRVTDMTFADNLGIRGFQLRTPQFGGDWEWNRPCAGRRATHRERSPGDAGDQRAGQDRPRPHRGTHHQDGPGFLRPYAGAARKTRRLRIGGALRG
jgi:histidinol-phosphatase